MIMNLQRAACYVLAWTATALMGQSESSMSPATQRHIANVESGLLPEIVSKGDGHPKHALRERMNALHVPGLSVAVIHNGVLEWARGYGVTSLGGGAVNAETLFQAGSISKPLAAMAALHLVQVGRLSLDTDVNAGLMSWKLPDAEGMTKPVTLRELLTHTAGITVHGFPGYAAGAPLPTLVQVLDGVSPANTPPIRRESSPGEKWNYSGGGYTIVQQLLIDVAKQPFPELLLDSVLAPIGMAHSTYEQPLPKARAALAADPYADGKPVVGGPHTYPEMAAAGLWTTPSDLAHYVTEVQDSLHGRWNRVLSKEMTRQMLTPGLGKWGLGLQMGGDAANPYFSHGGVNDGFESMMVGYENNGEGAVVMTNAARGLALADEVVRSIAAEYGWPDFRAK